MRLFWIGWVAVATVLVCCGGDDPSAGTPDGNTDTILQDLPSEDTEPVSGCDGQPEGTPCDDVDPCTTGDACDSQCRCLGAPTICPDLDGNPCTQSQCDAETGDPADNFCIEIALVSESVEDACTVTECVDGEVTNTTIAAQNDCADWQVADKGCVDHYVCDPSHTSEADGSHCRPVFRPDGALCHLQGVGVKAAANPATINTISTCDLYVCHQPAKPDTALGDSECVLSSTLPQDIQDSLEVAGSTLTHPCFLEDLPESINAQCNQWRCGCKDEGCTEPECQVSPAVGMAGKACNNSNLCDASVCSPSKEGGAFMTCEDTSGVEKPCDLFPEATCDVSGPCDPQTGCPTTMDVNASNANCLINNACIDAFNTKCAPNDPNADPVTGCVVVFHNPGTPCADALQDSCVQEASCQTSGESMKCEVTQWVSCDDGNACTNNFCADGACQATNLPGNCEDGNACTVNDSCQDGTCQGGDALNCDNGLFCDGQETCDATLGCVNGKAPNPSDGIDCTVDECSEEFKTILHNPDHTLCDNSLFCDGQETCVPFQGCVNGTVPVITDQVGCTIDYCDEDNDVVVHTPDDNACDTGQLCISDVCDLNAGCQDSTTPNCCGNKLVESNEECDDGNDDNGDGCSSTCTTESTGPTECAPLQADTLYVSQPSNGQVIHQHSLVTGATSSVVSDHAYLIAYNPKTNELYWEDGSSNIYKATPGTGTVETLLTDTESIGGLDLDYASGQIYWIRGNWSNKSNIPLVMKANLDGSSMEVLVSSDGTSKTSETTDLALNLTDKTLYYTSGYYGGHVMRAPLNGGVPVAVASTIGIAAGVAVNAPAQQIVWVEYGNSNQDRVMRANLDGSNVQQLINGSTAGLIQPRNVVLDLTAGHMYVSDVWGNKVARTNLDGTGQVTVLSNITDAYGLALGGPNPCPAFCGNGQVEEGETCDDGNSTDGDGCSSTCQTESSACNPSQPVVAGATVHSKVSATPNITLSSPSGTSNGSLLIAAITTNNHADITPPTGWTLLEDGKAGGNCGSHTFYHVVTGSSPNGHTFQFQYESTYASAVITTFQNVDPQNPIDDSSQTLTSGYTANAVSTSVDNGLFVLALSSGNGANTWTTPSGWSPGYNGGQNATSTGLFTRAQPTAGSSGSVTSIASSGDEGHAHLIALRAACKAVCGNGVQEGDEECDGGSECASDCTLQAAAGPKVTYVLVGQINHPSVPQGTTQTFTYETSAFITADTTVPAAALTSCSAGYDKGTCNKILFQPSAPGCGGCGNMQIAFLDGSVNPNYYFPSNAFTTTGTHTTTLGNTGTLTVTQTN